MGTYGQISFETATSTPMPHASGRSLRGGDRHGPNHTSSGALCVELSEFTSSFPNGETGRAAAIARPRPPENLFVKSIFEWNRLNGILFFTVLRAISSTAVAKAFLHPSPYFSPSSLSPSLLPSLPPSLHLSFPPSLPAIVMVRITPHRVPCV